MGELLASLAGPLALPFCPFPMASEERGVGTNRCFSKENMMSPKPFLPARSVGGELRSYGRASACVVNWPPDALCGGCVASAGGSRRPDRRHRRGAWCSVSFPGHEIWHVDRL